MRIEAPGIEEDGVAAHRLHDGHVPVDQQFAQIAHLPDARADVIVLHGLFNADGHRFHIAPGQAAVRVQPFEDHHQVAQLFEKVPVVHGQPAADVDQIIFLGAHPRAVAVTAKLLQNLRDGLVGVSGFAFLNEEGILHQARGVEEDLDAVLIAQRAQRLDVLHAHRLAARHVDGAGQADVRDLVRAFALDQRFDLVEIDVALEGMQIAADRAPRR